jgi:hypothetical protein
MATTRRYSMGKKIGGSGGGGDQISLSTLSDGGLPTGVWERG